MAFKYSPVYQDKMKAMAKNIASQTMPIASGKTATTAITPTTPITNDAFNTGNSGPGPQFVHDRKANF